VLDVPDRLPTLRARRRALLGLCALAFAGGCGSLTPASDQAAAPVAGIRVIPAPSTDGGPEAPEAPDAPDAPDAPEAGPVEVDDGPVRVVLYGDSLAVEAQEAFRLAVSGDGRAEVLVRIFGGTAICDFFETMRADLAAVAPDVVVMEFSGNSVTPCVNHEPISGELFDQRYAADAASVMELYQPLGIPVYWIGTPVPRDPTPAPTVDRARLRTMYSELPDRYPGAHYVDAAQSVLREGAYTEALPCLFFEPCESFADPVTGEPANRVRSPDGIHFCPVALTGDAAGGGCPVWSSGAWRFGQAMAEPVVRDFDLARTAGLAAAPASP
jgi:hypothetical protein